MIACQPIPGDLPPPPWASRTRPAGSQRRSPGPSEIAAAADQVVIELYDFRMDDETRALRRFLDGQREHVLGILEGLSEEELRRPVLPSGWSCLGLVKHLALGDEHYWFRCVVAGEPFDFFPGWNDERGDSDWLLEPDESAGDVFDLYRDEIERANAIIAVTPLDMEPRRPDERWGGWEVPDFRFIMLHMIEETACHAGHLDAVVELLNGRQWVVV